MTAEAANRRGTEEPAGVIVRAPYFCRRGRAVAVAREPIEPPRKPGPRPLRVARMLALAHEIVRCVEEGAFADLADAARALGFTRARITQLVDLTLLAPEIQEEILFAVAADGRDPVSERSLRALVQARRWSEQAVTWGASARSGRWPTRAGGPSSGCRG